MTTSWVIINKSNGEVIMETFQKSVTEKVNTEKYKVVPILEYLVSINGSKK